jgi:hypothetical protein
MSENPTDSADTGMVIRYSLLVIENSGSVRVRRITERGRTLLQVLKENSEYPLTDVFSPG